MAKSSTPNLISLPAADIRVVPPMLALNVSAVPDEREWQYEIKLDGYRAVVVKTDNASVFSRRGHFSRRFRTIAAAFGNLPSDTILDGEVVALDSDGRPRSIEART
jgi:bifunctional non-homologous end joining protein LigD